MKLIHFIMKKSRLEKHSQFMKFVHPTKNNTMLDVGVSDNEYKESDNYFEKVYPFKNKIVALGIGNLSNFSRRYTMIETVRYDGKLFPFKSQSFDFVWSNAVLEHVGNHNRQELFISEMLRVAKKKVVFTTPNRLFPFELHTRLPFIHWLKKKNADWIYAKTGKKWATGDYMYLLTRKDLIHMLDKMKNKYSFSYTILNNKILGFTATFTILVNKK